MVDHNSEINFSIIHYKTLRSKISSRYASVLTAICLLFSASASAVVEPVFGASEGPTLLPGSVANLTIGARYIYQDVATSSDGVLVDAVIEIVSIVDADISDGVTTTIDTVLGVDHRFEPLVDTSAANGFVEWELIFVQDGTVVNASDIGVAAYLNSFTLEAIDVDGEEFFEAIVTNSYTLEGGSAPPTELVVSNNGAYTRFQSDADFAAGIDAANTEYVVRINYENISVVNFRNGSAIDSNDRQNSMNFSAEEVTFTLEDTTIVNVPPIVVSNTGNTSDIDATYMVNLLAGASDADGNMVTSTIALIDPNDATNLGAVGSPLVIPSVGTYTVTNAGGLTFVPVSGYAGSADVLFTVSDDLNVSSDRGTLGLTIADITDPVVTLNPIPNVNAAFDETSYPVSGTCTVGDGDVTIVIAGATPNPENTACLAGGTFSTTVNTSGIGQGAGAIIANASQTDAANNTGNAAQVTANKNTTAPAVTLNAIPNINIATNEAVYTVGGSCTTGDGDVTIIVAGATPNPATATCSGGSYSTTVNTTAIGQGTGVVIANASQTNAAGNTGSATQVTANKDTTAPAVTLNAIPDVNAAFDETSYPVSGTCTAGDGNVTVSIAGVPPSIMTPCNAGNWGAVIFNVSGIGDGSGVIVANASQTDGAGNPTNATPVTADKDATAPAVTLNVIPNINIATNEAAYTVEGSCTTGDGDVTIIVTGATPNPTTAACVGGSYSTTVNTTAIGQGTGVVIANASQTNAAGNTGSATQVTANKDTTAPAVTLSPIPNVNAVFDEINYPVSGTCTAGDGDVTIIITGATPNPASTTCTAGGTFATTVNTSGVGEGPGAIVANASQTDAGGNTGNATPAVTANKDTVVANPSCVFTPASATAGSTPVSVTCTGVETGSSITIGGLTCGAESAGSITCNGTAGGVGSNPPIGIIDPVGNTNSIPGVFAFDGAAPVVVITGAPTATSANANAYPVLGTCTTGDGDVTVSIVGVTPAQTAACVAGNWGPVIFDVSGLPDGTDVIDINASQTDGAGNVGNAPLVEADKTPGVDTDNDGIPDSVDIDDDNDGIPDTVEQATAINGGDTDGDGIPDERDLDADGDGISDIVESGLSPVQIAIFDADNDGVIDAAVPVGVNGLADAIETDDTISALLDQDGDGSANGPVDTDNDTHPDFQDLDADNDGIHDLIEVGGLHPDPLVIDADNNGVIDDNGTDVDQDGIPDSIDTNDALFGGLSNSPVDTDSDNVANFRDIDSDSDGITDLYESGIFPDTTVVDADNDGVLDSPTTDADGDGIPDSGDSAAGTYGDPQGAGVVDTDGDNVPDYLDLDSDNDSIPDVTEAGNQDDDNDGLLDPGGMVTFPPTNTDGLDNPDHLDLDSNNDGVNDIEDAENGDFDTDGDGKVDGSDDADEDGVLDTVDGGLGIFGVNNNERLETAINGIGSFGPVSLFMMFLLSFTRLLRRGLVVFGLRKNKLIAILSTLLMLTTFSATFSATAHSGRNDCGRHSTLTSDTSEDFNKCFYGGVGYLIATHVHPRGEAQTWKTSDHTDAGYNIYLGWHFKPRWFGELNYADIGDAGLRNASSEEGEISYKIPSLHIGYWFLKPERRFNVYAKAGLSAISNNATPSAIPFEKQNSVNLTGGVGVQWRSQTSGLFARLAADFYDRDANSVGINVGYYFGGSHRHKGNQKTKNIHTRVTPLMLDQADNADIDGDGDGVINERDLCPNTVGVAVDVNGCAIPDIEVRPDFSLRGVNFRTNSAILTPESIDILDKAAAKLMRAPHINVEVQAHTDNLGDADYNEGLSHQRALAVSHYLERKGINRDRMQVMGYGENQPRGTNNTRIGRWLNRRVELHIIN